MATNKNDFREKYANMRCKEDCAYGAFKPKPTLNKDGCVHTRPILVSAWLGELEPDQEPHESGKLEEMETIDASHVLLTGHYCANCDTLLDIEIVVE